MSIGFWILDIILFILWIVALSQEDKNEDVEIIMSLIVLVFGLLLNLFVRPLYYNSTASFYLSIKGEEESAIEVNQ